MNVAIITLARAGSKRIPKKNIKLFCGNPLIYWTLKDAYYTGYPHYVVTDSKEIKKIAESFKAIVIDEPEEFAGDDHKTIETMRFVDGIVKADIYVILQATSPIRDPRLVKEWIEHFIPSEFESAFSVYQCPDKYYYIGGLPINFEFSKKKGNETDRMPIYYENGSFYIFRRSILDHDYIIREPYNQYLDKFGFDIDEEIEWKIAENFYKNILEKK